MNLSGPISVLWDIENVQIPAATVETGALTGSQIVLRIESALAELGLGPIHEFKAFLDIGKDVVKQEMRSELQCSNVMLVDATSVTQSKDLADKMLVVHMFSFALDHPPPATIVLISGDVDFAMPLAALRMRKYHIVLVLPLGRPVNPKLKHLAHTICYFNDILYPEKLYMPVAVDAWLADAPEAAAADAANNAALLNLLTPQHLLKSKTELRADRSDLDRLQKLADPYGHETINHRLRRETAIRRNATRGIDGCTFCGKTNHSSDRCRFRPKGSAAAAAAVSSSGAAPRHARNKLASPKKNARLLPKIVPAKKGAAPVAVAAAAAVAVSTDDDEHHDGDDDDDDDDDAHATLDARSLWLHQAQQEQQQLLRGSPSRPSYLSDDDSGGEDDVVDDLLRPEHFRGSSDNLSLLSEPGAQVHMQDMLDVLSEICDGGETQPFVSRVGLELQKRYAFYRTGMARQLLTLARKAGLVRFHGAGPTTRVELVTVTVSTPQRAAPAPPTTV